MMPTPSRGTVESYLPIYKILIYGTQDLPVPTVSLITAVIKVRMTVFDCYAISQYFALLHSKIPLQYQGHTVWYKRYSALVSGRAHYGLGIYQVKSRIHKCILHLKLNIIIEPIANTNALLFS